MSASWPHFRCEGSLTRRAMFAAAWESPSNPIITPALSELPPEKGENETTRHQQARTTSEPPVDAASCTGRPPPLYEDVEITLIDVLLNESITWKLVKHKSNVFGFNPDECDFLVPQLGFPWSGEQYMRASPDFCIAFNRSTGQWWIRRIFDFVRFSPFAEKSWLRSPSDDAKDADGGSLFTSIIEPYGYARLEDGDVFDFGLAANGIRTANLRFVFSASSSTRVQSRMPSNKPLVKAEKSVSDQKSAAEKKKPPVFENLPELALALIASYIPPEEVVDSLIMAYPGLATQLRFSVPWPKISIGGTMDSIRILTLAASSKVSSLDVGNLPTDESPKNRFSDVLVQVVKMLTGSELKHLTLEDPKILVRCGVPTQLASIVFKKCPQAEVDRADDEWIRAFLRVKFPETIKSVSFECVGDDGAPYKLEETLMNAFPEATKFSFVPGPPTDFWDAVQNERLAKITSLRWRRDGEMSDPSVVEYVDGLKKLTMYVDDFRKVNFDSCLYFPDAKDLETLAMNLLVLGDEGLKDGWWEKLAKKSPNVRNFKIWSAVAWEAFLGAECEFAVCNDEFVTDVLATHFKNLKCLVLHDCVISVDGIVECILAMEDLEYFRVRTTTEKADFPWELLRQLGDPGMFRVQWSHWKGSTSAMLRSVATTDLTRKKQLDFVFSKLSSAEEKKMEDEFLTL